MTFSTPVTPTRESDRGSVGFCCWTSGCEVGICAMPVGKGSESRKTPREASIEGTDRASACRWLCYHSPGSGDPLLGEMEGRERVEHHEGPASRGRGADH